MPEKKPASPLEALATQRPVTLISQLRAVWPEVQAALKAGHRLREVHKALNESGIAISYRRLTDYRSRIRKSNKSLSRIAKPTSSTVAAWSESEISGPGPDGFDPATNFREQIKKRTNFQYPLGPPDESKLF
jgi:hypothetical protein